MKINAIVVDLWAAELQKKKNFKVSQNALKVNSNPTTIPTIYLWFYRLVKHQVIS